MDGEKDKNPTCHRCGNCCHVDVAGYAALEDVRRWEKEGRQDILSHLRDNNVTWSHNGFANRFGLDVKTCRMSCIYLTWRGSVATCEIYETRTKVCRNFVPGSSNLCPLHRSRQQAMHKAAPK